MEKIFGMHIPIYIDNSKIYIGLGDSFSWTLPVLRHPISPSSQGDDVRGELLALVKDLPSQLDDIGAGAKGLLEAINLYQACVQFVCDRLVLQAEKRDSMELLSAYVLIWSLRSAGAAGEDVKLSGRTFTLHAQMFPNISSCDRS